ncbi:ferredoxin [uncultured Nocardioides sp.]|uniref:ferredoxin n=1 Tax=uncultured Nocardioides sp. TaxID=198441 RepID=UPI002607DAE2|nr:ferredoxin [uncultured Nocardioides sp.]
MSGPVTLHVDPVACRGHGLCAELLPELVTVDEWGYPVVADARVPPALLARARRAVRACPVLALRAQAEVSGTHARQGSRAARPPETRHKM